MKSGKNDRSLEVWSEGLVGVWVGGGSIEDFRAICPDTNDRRVTNAQIEEHLNDVNERLGLLRNFEKGDAALARRFISMPQGTWMLAYDVQHRTLLWGQLADNETFDAPPRFNETFERQTERFQARKITNRVAFRLVDLPEAFLVLTMGQGTLHKIDLASELARVLIDHRLSDDVKEPLADLNQNALEIDLASKSEGILLDHGPADNVKDYLRILNRDRLDEWFHILGPVSWEGICCAYLILMHEFLPTCQPTGGTLADYDIVGKGPDGKRIFAQCKKDPKPYKMKDQDRAAFANLENASKFFFAYGGIIGAELPGVQHKSGEDILRWLKDDPIGMSYRELLRD